MKSPEYDTKGKDAETLWKHMVSLVKKNCQKFKPLLLGLFNGGVKGNSLENVSKVLSANGTWSIDENGKLMVRAVEAEKISTHRLEVEEKIQLKDQATGEVYCTWIEDGEWKKVKENCSP